MPFRFLFLDVDGVLNNNNRGAEEETEEPEPGYLLPRCLRQLSRIVKETDAQIILSSTWRNMPHRDTYLRQAFEKYGIPQWKMVTGKEHRIPFNGPTDREMQIFKVLEYLGRGNPESGTVDNWIALDDENNSALYPHNIRTRYFTGLTAEVADQAIAFLQLSIEQVRERLQHINEVWHRQGRVPGFMHNGQIYPVQQENLA